jgi:hypothetical protein
MSDYFKTYYDAHGNRIKFEPDIMIAVPTGDGIEFNLLVSHEDFENALADIMIKKLHLDKFFTMQSAREVVAAYVVELLREVSDKDRLFGKFKKEMLAHFKARAEAFVRANNV